MSYLRPSSSIFLPWWETDGSYTVTGSGAVFGDESDATYVDFSATDPSNLGSPRPSATFSATDVLASPKTVWIRCQALSGTPKVGWQLRNSDTGEMFTQNVNGVTVPSTITDLEIPYDSANGDHRAALAAGLLTVEVQLTAAGSIRVYEAWIEITTAALGQLYVNLSTTKNSPNWVSVCDGGGGLTTVEITAPVLSITAGTSTVVGGNSALGSRDGDSSYVQFANGQSYSVICQGVTIPSNAIWPGDSVTPGVAIGFRHMSRELISSTVSESGFIPTVRLAATGGNFNNTVENRTTTYVEAERVVSYNSLSNAATYYGSNFQINILHQSSGPDARMTFFEMVFQYQVPATRTAGYWNISETATPNWYQIHQGTSYANTAISGAPIWYTCCSHGTVVAPGPITLTITGSVGQNTSKFGSGTDSEVLQDSSTLTGWTLDDGAHFGEISGYFSGGPAGTATSSTVFTLHITSDMASPTATAVYWTLYADDSANVQYSMSGSFPAPGSYATEDIVLSSSLSASYDPVSFANSLAAGTVQIYLNDDYPINVYECTMTAS